MKICIENGVRDARKRLKLSQQQLALLSQNGESQSVGLDPGQLNYIRQIESGYIQRITDILEPILGRENVRAHLRVVVKRILRKHGYPPDKQEKATQTVLAQAELLGWEVAA